MEFQSDCSDDAAIVKFEAGAQPREGGRYAPYDPTLFQRFWNWLFPRLERGADLAEAYGAAEVAGRAAEVRRTAENAAEIAAKRDLSLAKAGVSRQQEVQEFIKNIEAIEGLQSPAGQTLAFAKLIENNPDVIAQVEVVETLVEKLALSRGLMLSRTDDEPRFIEARVKKVDQ
jgi:hypothetical protein